MKQKSKQIKSDKNRDTENKGTIGPNRAGRRRTEDQIGQEEEDS